MTERCPDPVRQTAFPEMGVLYLLDRAARTAINALVATNPALADGGELPPAIDPLPETAQFVLDCTWELIQAIDEYEQALDRQRDLQLELYDKRPF